MSATIYQRIQQFYDASSSLWEETWGEHMHHGFYGVDGKEEKDRKQAQIDLIEEILSWSGVEQAKNILDVGCGIGGSSLYLSARLGAEATGITLSPVQAKRANQRARELGFAARTNFQVADAQEMPFADNSYDLVWSLESGEHMPNKTKFIQECYRVLKPGGKLIVVTWCHRPTDRLPLTAQEEKHLAEIYRVYHLPYVISLPEYKAIARNISLNDIRTADWSQAVAPFWDLVILSAFNPKAIFGLLTSGWDTIQAALSLGLMSEGYKSGLIRFGLLSGTK
ncbi:MAG: methyltransferase domain-containing protein [Mastigocoleus sp. MO_167.B18]|nr:methyltransferase domain-containing protein [Mastigocoleus sp. MO_167.B18]